MPSELIAAFLYAQLEHLTEIQNKRKSLWLAYYQSLKPLAEQSLLTLPLIPDYATNNAHMFYVVTKNLKERDALIKHLKLNNIHAVFHYLSLHKSSYYLKNNKEPISNLPESDNYTDCLIRLPLFYDLKIEKTKQIASIIKQFYK